MRAAIGGDQDRRNVLAEATADGTDGGDAVAAIEMVIDENTGEAAARGLDFGDRLHRRFRIGHRNHIRSPRLQQCLHAIENRRVVLDADDQRAGHRRFRERCR